MENIIPSRFLEKISNPLHWQLRQYVGAEIVVGLEGKDQFGNRAVKYLTGIVGRERDSEWKIGLYEIVEDGIGKANIIMSFEGRPPIVEAFVPMIVKVKWDASKYTPEKEKMDLKFEVVADPFNPNDRRTNTYQFTSR